MEKGKGVTKNSSLDLFSSPSLFGATRFSKGALHAGIMDKGKGVKGAP